jgi:hypothetical protein
MAVKSIVGAKIRRQHLNNVRTGRKPDYIQSLEMQPDERERLCPECKRLETEKTCSRGWFLNGMLGHKQALTISRLQTFY